MLGRMKIGGKDLLDSYQASVLLAAGTERLRRSMITGAGNRQQLIQPS